MNPKVTGYIRRNEQWQQELKALREILLDTPLTEDLKWRVPCYTLGGSNVVLMHCFKEYCALLFHKGVLLKDPEGILIQQTKNVQSARQIRFTDVAEVTDQKDTLRAYILEAIEVEKSGQEVEYKETEEFEVPEELEAKFQEDPDYKAAFKALTPGRQRGYLLHFSGAKQSQTRASRIEKCRAKILEGKGLQDR